MNTTPFADVRFDAEGFSLPELKWRELVFTGAVARHGEQVYARDPQRPMSPFTVPDLFPEGLRFRAERAGERVYLRRLTD